MPLYKLRILAADEKTAEQAAAVLRTLPDPEPIAMTLFEARPPRWLVEAYYDREVAVADAERALADLADRVDRAEVEMVPATNWVAVSQAALPPVKAGGFIVHGSHDRGRCGIGPHVIEIEAGEAFGSGHNPTTAGCLVALGCLLHRRRFARVLDLGCGSGVLAIAAARALPAARIVASDNDPLAAVIARDNVRINRVAGRVRVVTATGLAHPRLRPAGQFDLVLANILPDTLAKLAPGLRMAMRTGGVAVLSGILSDQVRSVRATFAAAGFRLLRWDRHAEWAVLTMTRI